MPKPVMTSRLGKAATTQGSASARTPGTVAGTVPARARPRTTITELDCPCTPQELGMFSIHGSGEGPSPAEAIDEARKWARLRLYSVYQAVAKEHACKGSCVGVVILRWPEPSSFDVILSAKHGPGGKHTYRAFHGGRVTAWLSCESLADDLLIPLRDQPIPDMHEREFVGWRLVPPGTTIA